MSRFRIQTVRLACAAALGIAADPIHANGNTVVLTGDYINISTNNLGGIGNASTPPGIQFDATGTGTFNNAQDYLTPGSPFFGFSVSSAEEGLQHRNNAINRDIAAGWTMDSFVDQSGVAFGGSTLDNRTVWTGTYSNGGNVYTVVQDIGFNDDDRRITFQTTITAHQNLTNVQYLNVADPDFGAGNVTTNTRGATAGGITVAPEDLVLAVSQNGSVPGAQGYFTNSTTPHNTGVSASLWSNNPADYAAGTVDNNCGSGDCAVGLAFDVGTLNNGESKTLVYYLIFGTDIADLLSQISAPPPPTDGFAPKADTPGAGAAQMLDQLNGAGGTSTEMQSLLTDLGNMSDAEQRAVLARIAPQTSSAAAQIASAGLEGTLDAVDLRILGQELAGPNQANLKHPILVATTGSLSGLLSGSTEASQGLWVKMLGRTARQGIRDGYAGFDSRGGGAAFGYDIRLGGHWLVGAALSVSTGKASFNDSRDGDETQSDSTQATLYGSRDFGTWYLSGSLSYAQHRFSNRRNTGLSGTASSKFDADQIGVRVGVGRPMQFGHYAVTPQASFEWSELDLPGYSETGAGPMSLNVSGTKIERTRSRIGARLAREWQGANATWVPFVHAFWQHEFRAGAPGVDSAFVGGGGSFVTPAQPLPKESLNLGLGTNLQIGRNFTAEVRYDFDTANAFRAHALQAMARWSF